MGVMSEPVLNKRIWSDGMSGPNHKQGWLSHLVALVTLTIYIGWLNILLGLVIAAFFYKWALYAVIAIVSTVFLPAKPVLWPAFNRLPVFRTWREYFNMSYLSEAAYEAGKRYIYVEFPHGAFPIGPVTAGTLMQTMFPGAPIYSVAASSVFYIPFWKHFITWIGSVPATKPAFKRLLKNGCVAVVLGGIAEMFMQGRWTPVGAWANPPWTFTKGPCSLHACGCATLGSPRLLSMPPPAHVGWPTGQPVTLMQRVWIDPSSTRV